jgi:hypothetical protein
MSSPLVGLIAFGALAAAGFGLLLEARRRDQVSRDARRRVFEVRFPRTLTTDQVRAFLASLMGLAHPRRELVGRDAAVLEVIGTGRGVQHRLRLPAASASHFVAQLRATVPGVALTEIKEDDKRHDLPILGNARELRLTQFGNPLAISDAENVSRQLIAACLGLRSGDVVVWSWNIVGGTPSPVPAPEPASGTSPLWQLVWGTGGRRRPASRRTQDEGLIRATVRIGARAVDPKREAELVARLRRVAASVSAPGARLTPRNLPPRLVARRVQRGATPLIESSVVLSRDELTALVGWPIGGPALPGLTLGRSPQLPVAPDVPRTGRPLGRATVGTGRVVAQSLRGAREHSLYLGPTGSGKTWLAAQVALADVAAGRGVLVLDPKGGTVQAILERLPEEAIGRTIVVDPTDEARPVPLPLLTHEAGGIPELAADTLIGLLRHRYSDLGPRSSDVLSSSLYALAHVPGSTLFDLFRLWGSPRYRAHIVAACTGDPALMSFFAWFDGLSASERNFILAAPSNKIRPLVQRPVLRNVIAAPRSTFTMADALARNLVVLVSLPEGTLGAEATTLIGQVLLSRLWSAVQGRDRRAASHPYFVTIDEAPRFVDQPTDLGDVLARAREYGVGVTLIAQTLAQFPTTLRGVAVNSARTKVAFQASAEDARRLADEFGPMVTADMLAGLTAFEAIGAVSVGGATSDPFTFKTEPLGDPIPGRARAVRSASRNQWGVARAEIEASFTTTPEPPPDAAGPVGRRQIS